VAEVELGGIDELFWNQHFGAERLQVMQNVITQALAVAHRDARNKLCVGLMVRVLYVHAIQKHNDPAY
jgi:hypothetical protein